MSNSEFYNLSAEKPNGEEYKFDSLKDKVVLIVNTASELMSPVISHGSKRGTHQANAASRHSTRDLKNCTTLTKTGDW